MEEMEVIMLREISQGAEGMTKWLGVLAALGSTPCTHLGSKGSDILSSIPWALALTCTHTHDLKYKLIVLDFFLFIYYSLIYYILIAVFPPSSPLSLSPRVRILVS